MCDWGRGKFVQLWTTLLFLLLWMCIVNNNEIYSCGHSTWCSQVSYTVQLNGQPLDLSTQSLHGWILLSHINLTPTWKWDNATPPQHSSTSFVLADAKFGGTDRASQNILCLAHTRLVTGATCHQFPSTTMMMQGREGGLLNLAGWNWLWILEGWVYFTLKICGFWCTTLLS